MLRYAFFSCSSIKLVRFNAIRNHGGFARFRVSGESSFYCILFACSLPVYMSGCYLQVCTVCSIICRIFMFRFCLRQPLIFFYRKQTFICPCFFYNSARIQFTLLAQVCGVLKCDIFSHARLGLMFPFMRFSV